jgi:transcription-repair coupling factor (superfamily II helicase)
MIDRFGPLPQEVENLFKLIEIKILCYKKNIKQIEFGTKGLLIAFFQNNPKNPQKILELSLQKKQSNIKLRPDNKIFYNLEGSKNEDKFNLIKRIIKLIS